MAWLGGDDQQGLWQWQAGERQAVVSFSDDSHIEPDRGPLRLVGISRMAIIGPSPATRWAKKVVRTEAAAGSSPPTPVHDNTLNLRIKGADALEQLTLQVRDALFQRFSVHRALTLPATAAGGPTHDPGRLAHACR